MSINSKILCGSHALWRLVLVSLFTIWGGALASNSWADLVVQGSATFVFDEALSGAATPLNRLNAVFKGTQTRSQVLDLNNPGDSFDSINVSRKTVTFQVNGSQPDVIVGRPNNAATTLDFDPNNFFASWNPGIEVGGGAFLVGGEQIVLRSMTRWQGDFTGVLVFGDFAIRYSPTRASGARSGLVLTSNIDFANATYADFGNLSWSANATGATLSGDLLYAEGFALLTSDPTDVGVKFGTFQVNLSTVPEPGSLIYMLALGSCSAFYRRRRTLANS